MSSTFVSIIHSLSLCRSLHAHMSSFTSSFQHAAASSRCRVCVVTLIILSISRAAAQQRRTCMNDGEENKQQQQIGDGCGCYLCAGTLDIICCCWVFFASASSESTLLLCELCRLLLCCAAPVRAMLVQQYISMHTVTHTLTQLTCIDKSSSLVSKSFSP